MAISSPAFPAAARPSAFDVASSAMTAVAGRVDADAATLASSGPDVSAIVDLDIQHDSFDALAVCMRASDEMVGSVLDILA